MNDNNNEIQNKLDVILSRLDDQEEKINRLTVQAFPQGMGVVEELPSPPPLPTETGASPVYEPVSADPGWFDRFVDWVKEDWLMKLGALLLLIGFGWLASYAFLNNWIGPMGRIALGIIAGASILLLGWWRMNKFVHQGSIFLVLGSTIMLLTIFAAREIYEFFTPLSALVIMFLSTAFVALASVKYDRRSLALASLLLAGVAPLLTDLPDLNFIPLFAYLFVVTVGAIWVVAITGWRILTAAALVLITLYSLPHFESTGVDTDILLLFAFAFAGLFFITNTLGILKLKGKAITSDLVTAAGNGLFLLTWIVVAVADEWQSLVMSAWMIVFAFGAFMLFRATQRREPFYVYLGVGIGMLAAATAAELDGATLTIAYTIESAIIPLVAYYVMRDIRIVRNISLLLIGPMFLSFGSIASSAWHTGIFHQDFFVLLTLTVVFLCLGIAFRQQDSTIAIKDKNKKISDFSIVMFIISSIYAYILLWISLHASSMSNDTATMISLLTYTVIGLATYMYGKIHDSKELRIYGAILLGFVVGRLLLVDVWKMVLSGRIITFFAVGTLLMSTAFFSRKQSKQVAKTMAEPIESNNNLPT